MIVFAKFCFDLDQILVDALDTAIALQSQLLQYAQNQNKYVSSDTANNKDSVFRFLLNHLRAEE